MLVQQALWFYILHVEGVSASNGSELSGLPWQRTPGWVMQTPQTLCEFRDRSFALWAVWASGHFFFKSIFINTSGRRQQATEKEKEEREAGSVLLRSSSGIQPHIWNTVRDVTLITVTGTISRNSYLGWDGGISTSPLKKFYV